MNLSRLLDDDLGRLIGLLMRDAPRATEARRLAYAMRRALRVRRRITTPGPIETIAQLRSDALVAECPLGCPVTAVVCVARQIQSDLELARRADPSRPVELKRHDKKRGTTTTRPTCVTSRCALGATVRLLHGDTKQAREMAARAPRGGDAVEG